MNGKVIASILAVLACVLLQEASASERAPAICLHSLATGPCKGYFERWGYVERTNECQSFIYGGCRGNSNNFMTKEDCERACILPR